MESFFLTCCPVPGSSCYTPKLFFYNFIGKQHQSCDIVSVRSLFLINVLYKLHAYGRSSEKGLKILYGFYVRTQNIFTACKGFIVFQCTNIFGSTLIFLVILFSCSCWIITTREASWLFAPMGLNGSPTSFVLSGHWLVWTPWK